MNVPLLHPLAEAYKRRRHTLGFGVHSPLAYYLVRNVVRDWHSYRYYCFHDFDVMTSGTDDRWLWRRRARVVHRLVARMRPGDVRWIGEPEPVIRHAVETAIPRRGEGRLTIAVAPDRDTIDGILEGMAADDNAGKTMLLLLGVSGKEIERTAGAIPSGVVLTGKDSLLAVVTKKVVKVRYTVVL